LQALKQKGTIKRIVLLMNTACVMQMKHIKEYDIDACVLLGAGGITSFKAIANVLSGKINPSGHLVDTIAYDVYSAPANENFGHYTWTENRTGLPTNIQVYNNSYLVYQEGIYVGYKYYETRYEDSVIGGRNANGTAGVKAGQNGWKYGDEVAYPFGYGLSYTTFEYVGFKVSHKSGKYGGTYNVSVSVKNSGEVAGKTAVGVYLQKPYTPYDEQNGVEKA
ncbi:MAG: glycoside hydrolase family 3 C-terminal domain-containing protein, partial [Clostridiales bacterium]|nr:glycoside hydrolase family 3 C-terminal domain-containing protein [Clostridiales bacterium]